MMLYELDDIEKAVLMGVEYLNPTGTEMWDRTRKERCAWCGSEPSKEGCYCRKCPSCTSYWKDVTRTDYSDGLPATKECPKCEGETR